MIEFNGRTYQTGNGTPTTPKKLLRSLCKDGLTKCFIHKGKAFELNNLLEGTIKPQKEYFGSFEELTGINPDVILKNAYNELIFLYEL